jgi:hypothetical protein
MSGGAAIVVLGGFTVLDVLPALPPAPILTGELSLAWPLGERVTLGGRYATNLGVQHRLGPELRIAAMTLGPVSLGLRLHPSASLAGTPDDVAGDLATLAAITAEWRRGALRLALEGGVTVEWLVYEHIGGDTRVDDAPYLASVDVAAAAAWTLASGVTLVARLELGIPQAPDDPFAVLGVYPRLLAGASWRL